jgi:hypothetical protein
VTALTYTGTESDQSLLLDEGTLDPEDTFEVISLSEARELHERFVRWALLQTRHDSFWHGYRIATADAAMALAAVEPKPSLLTRLVGWLA